MSPKRQGKLGPEMAGAIEQLKSMVKARYPDATFQVAPDPEDPGAMDLIATVDVEDIDEVLDIVIDRVLELQLEEELPVHVIPIRPLDRVLKEMRRPRVAPDIDLDLITPLT